MRKRVGYFGMALVVFAACFLVAFVVQKTMRWFLGVAFDMTFLESAPIVNMAEHISFVLVFGLWYNIGLKRFRLAGESLKRIIRPRNVIGVIVLSLGEIFLTSFALALIEPYLPREILEKYMELSGTVQVGENMVAKFTGSFVAPIGEEFIFRGVMLYFLLKSIKGLKKEKALFWAVNLVQALAFGAFHGNWYQFIHTTPFALLVGYMMYRSKTIVVPIAIHMINNVWGILIVKYVGPFLPYSELAHVLYAAAGFVVMMVGVLLVKRAEEEEIVGEAVA